MSELNNIPKHWQVKKLGEVADYINGRAFKPTEWENSGIPIIRIQNLNKAEAAYNFSSKEFEERYKLKKGDLLYAWSASFGVYIWSGEKAWLNQHIFKVVPKSICDKKFLFYTLDKITTELYSKAHGSGMVHVTKGKFEGTEILLPPLPEQLAIVSKIEELLSDLENGKQQLITAQQQLKVYRQSLLKAAFEGKLTSTSLSEQKDGELPKGWKYMKFGELFVDTPQNGIYKPSTKYGSGTPILRIDGFYDGVILANYDYKRVQLTTEEIEKYHLSLDDIVVNRVNSMSHLGKCGLVKTINEKTVFESNVMKIQINKRLALPKFITFYLASSNGIKELTKNAKHAVNQASINQTDVSNATIPLPTLFEQHQIVEILESKLTVCDKIEETISQSLLQAETLKQSILKKAFEGRFDFHFGYAQ